MVIIALRAVTLFINARCASLRSSFVTSSRTIFARFDLPVSEAQAEAACYASVSESAFFMFSSPLIVARSVGTSSRICEGVLHVPSTRNFPASHATPSHMSPPQLASSLRPLVPASAAMATCFSKDAGMVVQPANGASH